jgi:sigma-B regulation protein RsbU (phosphoserine phosphatase)
MTSALLHSSSNRRSAPFKLGLRGRVLVFLSSFLALAVTITVMAMSWNARSIVIEQVERDVHVLARVLAQSISISQQLPDQMEDVIAQGMQAAGTSLAHFVAAAELAGQKPEQIKLALNDIISKSMISEIWITDPKGKAYLYAPLKDVDFTFSPDAIAQPQASAFWPLLGGQVPVINQAMSPREIDGKSFKYVGVPGVDKARIVQVGASGDTLTALRETVGIQKLVKLLVAQGALKAIFVVEPDMTPVVSEISTPSSKGQLNRLQSETLKAVMVSGKGRTEIVADHIEVFQLITDEYGNRMGAFVVQLPRQGLDDLLKEQVSSALIIGFLVFTIGALVSLSFADRIAKPISTVTQVASQVQQGDFSNLHKLEPASARRDEIGELARVFSTMASEVQNRERVLDGLVTQRTQELADKNNALVDAQALINQELDLARRLQMAILPDRFPPIAHCNGHARMLPATQMGGDFYDFIRLPDGRVAMVMADVSGKGVTAAFFMAVARTCINSLIRENANPALCLENANNELCSQNPLDLFVTVFLGILDPVTGMLTYANGGHNPPLLRSANNATRWIESTGDMALGVMPEMTYTLAQIQMRPGDMLLSYTDGVTEAFNSEWVAYGEERLLAQVEMSQQSSAWDMVEHLFSDVSQFANGAPQSDDITVAALTWEPRDHA